MESLHTNLSHYERWFLFNSNILWLIKKKSKRFIIKSCPAATGIQSLAWHHNSNRNAHAKTLPQSLAPHLSSPASKDSEQKAAHSDAGPHCERTFGGVFAKRAQQKDCYRGLALFIYFKPTFSLVSTQTIVIFLNESNS